MSEIDYQLALLLQHKFEKEAKQVQNTVEFDSEFAKALHAQLNKDCAVVESLQVQLKQDAVITEFLQSQLDDSEAGRSLQTRLKNDMVIAKSLQTRLSTYKEYAKSLQTRITTDSEFAKSLQTQFADSKFAKSLQTEFNKEYELDQEGRKLSYNTKSNKCADSSKSLIDPSWEVVDPTPDIHTLFMAFNERFFWNKLLAVCVSWSKRMTSCAGVCSYQGRGGMCKITLSEPLLKLRPRKDLVETLLHEMIHAYLFVTHNNRDRDGHGMEFQKHMFRINAKAGTRITIYHDFHEEVKLYKQYWWKCTGPCQNWRPYYGIVKRATNRAPAPTDRWFAEHYRSCGGVFLKIKEPGKKLPKKGISESTTMNIRSSSDIRKYYPTSSPKNKKSVATTTKTSQSPTVKSKSPNIFEFTDILKGNKNDPIVLDKTPDSKGKTKANEDGARSLDSPSTSSGSKINYSQVRNAWVNKYPNSGSGLKRNSGLHDVLATIIRDDVPKNISNEECEKSKKSNSEHVKCPACNKSYDIAELNAHLDQCLHYTKECIICGKQIDVNKYKDHTTQCSKDVFGYPDVSDSPEDCAKNKRKSEEAGSFQLCEICDTMIETEDFEIHIGYCLNKMYDNSTEVYSSETVNCLACDRSIPKDELNTHLEQCNKLCQIFDDTNVPLEEN